MARQLLVTAALAALASLPACGGDLARDGPPNPLRLPETSPGRTDPAITERILSRPHDYFRFINTAFAREVCARFEPYMQSLPVVNLHGDAHLEQIAATSRSLGLVDFDDSASGPPVIDLVRFGVSIELAADRKGWQDRSDALLSELLFGYRQGLTDAEPPETPSVVSRLRADFSTPLEFLEWANDHMVPLSEVERADATVGFERYVDFMLRLNPTWAPSKLSLVRWGRLTDTGIGSSTTNRYLVRIEGDSPVPEDDVILEAKELRDVESVPCVVAQRGNALRVLASAARFGQHTDPYLAIIPRSEGDDPNDRPWWVQSWTPRYAEVDIDETFETVEELAAVARAAGYQLAHGHTNLLPPPYDRQLQELVKVMLDEHAEDIRKAVLDLTGLTLDAYRELRGDME